jgi:hypothetical protein
MMLDKCRNNKIYYQLYVYSFGLFINFAFNIHPFLQKVHNIDLNDEACELNRKKTAAGTKMNGLQGFGPHPNIRRASLRPEKSNFDRELGVCLCAFYCSK